MAGKKSVFNIYAFKSNDIIDCIEKVEKIAAEPLQGRYQRLICQRSRCDNAKSVIVGNKIFFNAVDYLNMRIVPNSICDFLGKFFSVYRQSRTGRHGATVGAINEQTPKES